MNFSDLTSSMLIQPVDYALLAWFALAALSTLYVAWDQFANNPEPAVMKWGFVLVTLYMGPIGLLLYVLTDKEPRPGTHEAFVAPQWKQGVGSTVHCAAGDATGIIVAAVITATLGLPMWIDLIVEYVAGFAFGLFIFQALFMKKIMGGSYLKNLRRSFMPEFISMNAMMAGMVPIMSFFMMGRDMRGMVPTELLFWGIMALGIIVGFGLAYPANVWMVQRGLKHGLMTTRADKATAANTTALQVEPSASPHQDHAAKERRDMSDDVTTPQLLAVAGFTTFMLVAGVVIPAFYVNFNYSSRDVGGAIMPKGMIMDFDTPAEAMRDMSAVHPRLVSLVAPKDARGDRPLAPRIENGVKVFDLEASVIRWHILPDVAVEAYAYNGQVPGPRLEVNEGDRLRINFHNALPESTTVHWHGLLVPNDMDGPAKIAQSPVPTGGTFSYEYTVGQHGTYFYHTHDHSDRQQALGLYGALIVRPKSPASEVSANLEYVIQLQEWLKREWLTYPAMSMEGGLPNYFTINGKAFPATDKIDMRVGQTLKLRFIGTHNNFIHPMHVHGGPFEVVAIDGETMAPSARYFADTVNVGSGQRFDVIWTARRPGKWLVHCHIPHHTTNNNVERDGAGGLAMVIEVRE